MSQRKTVRYGTAPSALPRARSKARDRETMQLLAEAMAESELKVDKLYHNVEAGSPDYDGTDEIQKLNMTLQVRI